MKYELSKDATIGEFRKFVNAFNKDKLVDLLVDLYWKKDLNGSALDSYWSQYKIKNNLYFNTDKD